MLGEPPVVVGHERGEERRGSHRIVEAAQPQLLDEPVLQGAVGPFNAPFGFGAAGTEQVDGEVVEGAAELRQPGAALGAVAGLNVEDAEPVAVERHRLAVPLEVALRGSEVVERGLDLGAP